MTTRPHASNLHPCCNSTHNDCLHLNPNAGGDEQDGQGAGRPQRGLPQQRAHAGVPTCMLWAGRGISFVICWDRPVGGPAMASRYALHVLASNM